MTTTPATSMRERVVATAAVMTAEVGWRAITMAKLADRVGVSRQTVYNEIGSKPALAEAMVLAELGKFLTAVGQALDAHPGDLVAGIREAARSVLQLAADNALLQAIVTASYGAETELLPLLTTRSDVLLETATSVIRERIPGYRLPLTTAELESGLDMVVRLVLSHVMHPTRPPAETADDIAWLAGRVLSA